MQIHEFLHLPPPTEISTLGGVSTYLRRMWDALQQARKGKLECVTQITLTANAASTTLTDIRLTAQSVLVFDPLTANAAAEKAAGTLYVTEANRDTGQWVITHANNAQTDREFMLAIIG